MASGWIQEVDRRGFIVLTAALAAGTAAAAATAERRDGPPVILVFGDSLSAEYGLRRGTGWVALLERRLQDRQIAASVVNASISGETTSGGRSRLDALLHAHRPQVVVLELGANDALRGLPLAMTEENLAWMAKAAQEAGAQVLLLGMQVPPNYGSAYTDRFSATFGHVAEQTGAALVPFFLKDVADVAEPTALFQADRIHPNASAQSILLDNVWPKLEALLKR